MNTRVFRIGLEQTDNINERIATSCDFQLTEGYRLAATFVWGTNLVLIFQKVVDTIIAPKPITS